jgi:hypothetical protein
MAQLHDQGIEINLGGFSPPPFSLKPLLPLFFFLKFAGKLRGVSLDLQR